MPLESLSLRTNLLSLNAQRNLSKTEKQFSTAMDRLSSVLRITSAADDAAGLAISERLRAQISSFSQAQRNANDAVSLLQTAEGALAETGEMLIRMRELSVQAANGTLGTNERLALHQEFTALRNEIDRIANSTSFNGRTLLTGGIAAGVTFQVGAGNTANDQITLSVVDSRAAGIGVSAALSISTVADATVSITVIDTAIASIASTRGTIGAGQNRVNVTLNNLSSMIENLSAANSRIRDADVATETANFARSQILMQAGLSVLSQANALPSMALSLIAG